MTPTPTPPASPSDAAMQAAREILEPINKALSKMTPSAANYIAFKDSAIPKLARIIDKHLSASLAAAHAQKVEDYLNERHCCSGFECGCMGLSRLDQAVAEEAGSQLTALRQSVAMLSGALTYYANADFLTTEQQEPASNALKSHAK